MGTRHLDDWLENYLYLTRLLESPLQYNLWSGIAAISSALRRKCFINWGLRGYTYPNFYIALVGPPGGRKGTAMKIAKKMVENLEVPIGSDALGSSQALYNEMVEAQAEYLNTAGKTFTHKSLSIWSEEFQVFLSGKDPMIVPALTDLFDCADKWKYSSLKRGAEDLSNCWLTIIGAITPQLLQDLLTREAVGGGLSSRIIFVVGYGAVRRIAFPLLSEEEYKLMQQLEEDLAQIALLTGPFKLADSFIEPYATWYEGVAPKEGPKNEHLLGYDARRALHVSKLSMIISASESGDMSITGRHFEKALAILEETEAEMPNAFYGVTNSIHSEQFTDLVRYMEVHESCSFKELLWEFQLKMPVQDLERHLASMTQSGKVIKERSSTKVMYRIVRKEAPKKESRLLERTLYRRISK